MKNHSKLAVKIDLHFDTNDEKPDSFQRLDFACEFSAGINDSGTIALDDERRVEWKLVAKMPK